MNNQVPMNASEVVKAAIVSSAKVVVDHTTRAFVGFRITLPNGREEVIRCHKKTSEAEALSQMASD